MKFAAAASDASYSADRVDDTSEGDTDSLSD